jgi:hypothetical protein
MISPDTTLKLIKDNLLKHLDNIKNTNITTYFSSNNLVINLVVFYIIYTFTKDIIKGLITAILYTAVITLTIMYAYKYINPAQEKK